MWFEAHLTPATNERTELFLEFSASVVPSERMMRLRLKMPAAPRPWIARPTSSMAHVCAVAHKTLPTIIQNISNWRAKCLPYMSASCPEAGMKVVKVRVYAATIQLKLPPKWPDSCQ
jgi:hypothetical protein